MAQLIRAEPSTKKSAKQPTTICSLGTSDRLRSSIEQFNKSFVGKRVLKTAFLLSGESKRDYRKVFTSLLRHTFHGPNVGENGHWSSDPAKDILCPRRTQDPDHTVSYNGVELSTDEIQLEPTGLVVDQVREFVSPYSLQFMEDLSWNLNRRKCLPYGLSVSQQNDWTLNTPNMDVNEMAPEIDAQGNAKPTAIFGLDVNSFAGHKSSDKAIAVADPTEEDADNIATRRYFLSDKLVSEPLLTDVIHDSKEGQSQMRSMISLLNDRHFKGYAAADPATSIKARWQPKHPIGKYQAQIQSGACYYTFVNTSDSDMIVDMVVHKIKDGMAIGVGAGNQSITDRIFEHYGENWMDARIRASNSDLMNDGAGAMKHRPDDIYINPKVKFLPSSLRLNQRNTAKAVRAGTNVLVKYRHMDEIPAAAGLNPAADEALAVENFNPNGKWGSEMRERHMDLSVPPFTEVYRQQVIVLAGKRKTLTLRLPSKSYDPTQAVYTTGQFDSDTSSILNEHGFHVSFGVTGKKARTIIEPAGQIDPAEKKAGSKVIGIHHAATSFKVIGRYYESIIPAVCVAPDDFTEQDLKLEPDVAHYMDDKRMYSAMFNDVSARDVDGRYIRLLTDGQATKAQAERQSTKFKDWRRNRLTASRADKNLDESVMEEDSTEQTGGQSIKGKVKLQYTTPDRQKKAVKGTYEALDKLRRKIATFFSSMPSIPDTIETVGEWMDGHPHTVKKVKSAILAIGAWRSGDPKLAAMALEAAVDSGVTYEEIIAAKNELNDASLAGSAMMNLDTYDNLQLHTVDQKRRRLTTDEEIVWIDHDPTTDGIQQEDPAPTDVNITNDSVNVNVMDENLNVNVTNESLDVSATVTNTVDVNDTHVDPLTNGIFVTLTESGLAKLGALGDSGISYITQKLTNMVNYRATLPSTDANYTTASPRFDLHGQFVAVPVVYVSTYNTSHTLNDTSTDIVMGGNIVSSSETGSVPHFTDWDVLDNFSLIKNIHWSY
jgi:hypothetical protein